MTRRNVILATACLFTLTTGCATPSRARLSQTVDDRTDRLVAEMTTAEKLRLFEGDTTLDASGKGVTACVGHAGGLPRLGLPALCMGDGVAGVGNSLPGVTQFPAPITLAASWNTDLAKQFGIALGAEQSAKGRNVALAPTINIARSPLWGRTAETLGEDPFLTSRLAVPIVQGIQSNRVIAMPKHFVANNAEWLRFGDAPSFEALNVVVSQRVLREIYYPGFRAAVTEGKAGSLMCAYNRVNGIHACENATTLAVPRRDWGFDGFVTSDWYFGNRSTVAAANAGLDISMPGGKQPFGMPDFYGPPLARAIAEGTVSMERIDAMARRIVRPMVRLGLIDHPSTGTPDANVRSEAHTALARQIATQGIVLLRNEGRLLPLGKARSIAVIGDDAGVGVHTTERNGGFVKSDGIPIPTPFDAIRERAGSGISVTYARGTLGNGPLPILPDTAVRTPDGKPGLRASYFDNPNWSGQPMRVADVSVPDTADARPQGLPDAWSGRYEGVLTPDRSGLFRFSLSGGGDMTLMVNGQPVVRATKESFSSVFHGTIRLTAGMPVTLQLDYSHAPTIMPAEIRLGWQPANPQMIAEAVAIARAADVAVVFAADDATEGSDKTSLLLPGDQDELIAAVANANPRTVVVLHTTGPVLMPWKDSVGAIVAGWYAGEQAGPAMASMLFGDVDASGRLPITFPASQAQSPMASPELYKGQGTSVQYSEELAVGYRWYNQRGIIPLYPFGYGLSYTHFAYSGLHAEAAGDNWAVDFAVTNSGARPGIAVPQVYLTFPQEAGEPPRQLKAFSRLQLNPGETQSARVLLPRSAFEIWDTQTNAWHVVPGRYQIQLATSAQDPVATFDIELSSHTMQSRISAVEMPEM
ncbi:beta-glucosidase H [Sphingobium sp. YR768]|uniref:beta-glucosidase H n=1 Tax=Sphingobium sp. YR768 TaxID=1884365 RepID=UPI0008BFF057|nr:glycoside hydrolase family 3 C-terminal domain-containing protein [Sphingobium sp. YR768]SER30002.1 beta-glucosidase [Sphingobium sp. YR768]